MTQIVDPCNEAQLPSTTEPGPGPNPVEPRALEIPSAAFPVRQTDAVEQSTVRESAIIEKSLWVNSTQNNPGIITFSQVALRMEEYQGRPELIDTFRFCSGKNWRFVDGNLIFFNPGFEASFEKGVPFSIQTLEEQYGANGGICKISLRPDFALFDRLIQNMGPMFRNIPDGVGSMVFQSYIEGTSPFQAPLISDTENWKYDFSFKAPAAFFGSEVEQSSVPLVEGVFVGANYLGGPVSEPRPGAKEIDKKSAYRFFYNTMDPVLVPGLVHQDDTQIFFNLSSLNALTDKATSTELNSPIFDSDSGREVLNNHIRITLNTKPKLERDESFSSALSAYNLEVHFMNFLANSDTGIDGEKRFVQFLDQSVLGGAANNRQVVDYEPKLYEQSDPESPERADDNADEHSIFSAARLAKPLDDRTYSMSPIYYIRSQYEFLSQIPTVFNDLSQWWQMLKSRKRRTFSQILEGHLAHSEIMAYRIEKSNLDGEVIQNFYFFNRFDDDVLDFIDTQVFYNNTYTYRIYAINAVIGSKYKYTDVEKSSGSYNFTTTTSPMISFIETPYFEQQITMIDKPPMFPQVEIVPFFQHADRVGFRLTPTYGETVEKPVQILPEDQSKILKMQENSVSFFSTEDHADRPVHYSSDNPPTEYEILIMDEPPVSYQDFSLAQRTLRESDYNSGYIELNLEPNKRYYMIFRAYDESGISNPSSVYTLVLNSHIDGVYIEFDEYDMVSEDLAEPMTFERVLKIDPSPEQMSVDFSEHMEQENFYASAPAVSDLQLGTEDIRVWAKDYKFRLISRTTGKAIDLNIKYGYKTIITPAPVRTDDESTAVAPTSARVLSAMQELESELLGALSSPIQTVESEVATALSGPVVINGDEENSNIDTYDDEGGQRSRVRNRPTETVRERLEREERERRERERMESLRRDAASARNITTVYDYDN